ncbi:acetolactate synthase large subunit [Fictibacillus phosphorivorans]|uniref:acetolactate synthase large subunit n=1 Tax=Fictibacillus phosphorivorans TaxID=1221500 RepID=UPI002042505F|nr:acetolactate synthase large subunit [Fictibacillus phosphorivorans]MCM3719540.1 acetolactate synthase large subunit [Fictibacillus phosphorivorans]MCM3777231.1 acetolactate synthase large subunit [Fictibacillus phosphorivorans]
MKATDLLVRCLENEGVEYVFGIMGKETLDLIHSLSKSKQITYINVRHEQAAAFMADIYGRLSKKVGVCTATLGPGATNLLTGISSAQLDHSPVVAITGQAGFEKQHQESHQYIDIVKIFEPATKWSVQIKDSETIPKIIRKSFRLAQMEKKGAVLIELPENLASQMVSKQPIPVTSIPTGTPDTQTLESTGSLLGQYQKPLIIVGNGVIRQGAVKELVTFIEKLKSPVIHSFMAKGILPKNHPQNYYTFGFSEKDEVLSIIEEADLLFVIGYDFVEKPPKDWNKKQRPILHIDSLPAEMDEHYPLKGELVGDLDQTLQELNKVDLPTKPWFPAGNTKEKIKLVYQIDNAVQQNEPLTIKNVLKVIETVTTEQTIILSDVGAHKVSIARTFQPKQAGRLIISNGLASMGIALPGSIGAKLARPDAPVICITGDGGALMNITELETAKRLGLSFIVIILNNATLKLEKEMMQQKFNSSFGTSFTNPDFVQLANSFGVKGVRPKQLNELEQVLEEALKQTKEITLIDVQMAE